MGVLYAYLNKRCASLYIYVGLSYIARFDLQGQCESLYIVERANGAAPRFSFCVLSLLIIYPLLEARGTKTRKTMAHRVSKIIFGLLTLTFVASCSTEDSLVQETYTPAVKQQIITVGTPANGASTRVAYTDENVGTDLPALTWEEGDQLRISWWETSNEVDHPLGGMPDRKEVIYTLLPEDAGKTSGRFVGDAITADGPFDVSVVYPDGEAPALKDKDLSCLKRSLTFSLRADNVTDLSNIQLSSISNIYKLVFTNLPADLGHISFMKFAFKSENGGSVTYQSDVDISISEDKKSCTIYYVGNSTSELNTKTVEITLIGDRAYKVRKTVDTPKSYEALKRYTFTVDNTESTLVWQPTSECRSLGNKKVELVLHPGGIKDALNSDFFSRTISPENVNEIVIKGVMKNEDLALSNEFMDGISISASILANWLRTKATSVTSVDMSQVSGLTEIPKMAFYGCCNSGTTDLGSSSLSKMVLPEGITSFGNAAFNFAYLTELNFPTTLETIGESALRSTKISQFVFPQGLKTIGMCAMYWVGSNPSIIIPSSVTSIGDNIVDSKSTIVFEGSTYDLLSSRSFDYKVSRITLLLPEADISKASTVRNNTTGYEVYPTIYYGWNSTTSYEQATVEEKLNTNNYTKLN